MESNRVTTISCTHDQGIKILKKIKRNAKLFPNLQVEYIEDEDDVKCYKGTRTEYKRIPRCILKITHTIKTKGTEHGKD